ncbi:MAG: rhodanese-like domain-containing protein [Candidatus Marinimicrobia bacterium]|nr:rhodanese-like domain-containing protein [Candidatus Neomarinimicrobiota bacterium]
MLHSKIKQKLVFITILLLAVYSCSQNPANSKAETIIKDIIPSEAYQLIQENADNDDFIIIDVRTPAEYNEGHIEKAININFYNDDFRASLEELNKSRTYLIYCKMGGRSGNALAIMEELKFQQVYNLSSGISGWKSAGYSVIKEK